MPLKTVQPLVLTALMLLFATTTAKANVGTGFYVPDGAYCSHKGFHGSQAVAHVDGTFLSLTFMEQESWKGCHVPSTRFITANPELPLHQGEPSQYLNWPASVPDYCSLRNSNTRFNATSQTLSFHLSRAENSESEVVSLSPCWVEGGIISERRTSMCGPANAFCTQDNHLTFQYLPDNRYQVEAKSTSPSSCIASGYYIRDSDGNIALYRVNENNACKSMQVNVEKLIAFGCKFLAKFSIEDVFANQLLTSAMCAITSNTSNCFAHPDCSSCAQSPGCVWCGQTQRCIFDGDSKGQLGCLFDLRSPNSCRNGDRPVSTSMCGGAPWNKNLPSIINFNADTNSFTWGMLNADYTMNAYYAPAKACFMAGTYSVNPDGSIKYNPVSSTCPGADKLYFMRYNDTTPSEPTLSLHASYFASSVRQSVPTMLTKCVSPKSISPGCDFSVGKTLCTKDHSTTWTLDGHNRFIHTATKGKNNPRCAYSGFSVPVQQFGKDWFGLLYTNKSDASCPDQLFKEVIFHKNCSATLLHMSRESLIAMEVSESHCPSPPSDHRTTNNDTLSCGSLAAIITVAVVLVVVAVVIVVSRRSNTTRPPSCDVSEMECSSRMIDQNNN